MVPPPREWITIPSRLLTLALSKWTRVVLRAPEAVAMVAALLALLAVCGWANLFIETRAWRCVGGGAACAGGSVFVCACLPLQALLVLTQTAPFTF